MNSGKYRRKLLPFIRYIKAYCFRERGYYYLQKLIASFQLKISSGKISLQLARPLLKPLTLMALSVMFMIMFDDENCNEDDDDGDDAI